MQNLYGALPNKPRRWARWLLPPLAALSLVTFSTASALAAPAIKITQAPRFGDWPGYLKGTVSGVDFSKYVVAPYIQVDEVWWTKPYLANPTCPVNPDGTFSCLVTTGGCDHCATAFLVELMPKKQAPDQCLPCATKPRSTAAVASAYKKRPYPRALAFSGYKWRVKTCPDCKQGPGPNYFSDARRDVWVDAEGLHLRIRKGKNGWFSSEVVSEPSFGYGTYIFQTNSRVDLIDANMVVGLFTWDSKAYHPTHRELDVEFARWGNESEPTNAQFVAQPCSQCPGCDDCSRFTVELSNTDKHLTTYMTWGPRSVEFRTYRGKHQDNPPEGALIHQWTKTGADVPSPGKVNIRFNFWLLNGEVPINGEGSEVVIESFVFQPR
jgi:hypothetical protein